jgi:hypothetical protein
MSAKPSVKVEGRQHVLENKSLAASPEGDKCNAGHKKWTTDDKSDSEGEKTKTRLPHLSPTLLRRTALESKSHSQTARYPL